MDEASNMAIALAVGRGHGAFGEAAPIASLPVVVGVGEYGADDTD
jgi:hypothetical protein